MDYKQCQQMGGYWVNYSIHDQEWVSCKECFDPECPKHGAKNTEQANQPDSGE